MLLGFGYAIGYYTQANPSALGVRFKSWTASLSSQVWSYPGDYRIPVLPGQVQGPVGTKAQFEVNYYLSALPFYTQHVGYCNYSN